MKGFTKDGKFRPTGNKTKSSLKKSDIRNKKTVDIHNTPNAKAKMLKIHNSVHGKKGSKTCSFCQMYGTEYVPPTRNPSIADMSKLRKDESLDEPKMTFGEFLKSGSYLEDEIRQRAEKGSPYFFNADTMRGFSSRISELMWQKGGSHDASYKTKDIYFVTSEENKAFGEFRGTPRAYTVRVIDVNGDINEIGKFQEHEKLNDARHVIKDVLEGSN